MSNLTINVSRHEMLHAPTALSGSMDVLCERCVVTASIECRSNVAGISSPVIRHVHAIVFRRECYDNLAICIINLINPLRTWQ